MEIKGELCEEDFADFMSYFYLKNRLKKRLLINSGFALIIPLFIIKLRHFNLFAYIICVLICIVIFSLATLIDVLLIKNRSRKLLLKNGSILGNKSYTFQDNGFTEKTKNSLTVQNWQGIKKIESNKRSIFLFTDTFSAYIIPRRFFDGLDEEEKFIRLAIDQINKAGI
jgi:hypothetical protein